MPWQLRLKNGSGSLSFIFVYLDHHFKILSDVNCELLQNLGQRDSRDSRDSVHSEAPIEELALQAAERLDGLKLDSNAWCSLADRLRNFAFSLFFI